MWFTGLWSRIDMRVPFKILTPVLALASVAEMNGELRLSMSEAVKNAVTKPQPEYSAIARQMKVGGKVEVEVTIAADGTIEETKAIRGNPLLTASVANALKKWKFTPFQENGQPTKIVAAFSFDFKP